MIIHRSEAFTSYIFIRTYKFNSSLIFCRRVSRRERTIIYWSRKCQGKREFEEEALDVHRTQWYMLKWKWGLSRINASAHPLYSLSLSLSLSLFLPTPLSHSLNFSRSSCLLVPTPFTQIYSLYIVVSDMSDDPSQYLGTFSSQDSKVSRSIIFARRQLRNH